EKYPAVQIVLGFGNWGSVHWGTFDRAAAASDMTGIQGMRGSTRQTLEQYGSLYEGLQTGANKLQTLFGKPIMLTDIALSSYPEPQWLQPQADTLKEVFDHLPELKAAGVQAIIYRSWMDSPGMDLANYYGMAERYWGLANKSGLKPAAQVWIDGVKAERANAAPAPAPAPAPTAPFNATFTPSKGSNEWWVDVKVAATGAVASVSVTVNGGPAKALAKTNWGTWAASLNAPKGSAVVFTAKDPAGASAASKPIAWLMPAGTTPTAPAPAPAFNASFTPSANVNAWWVDVKVTSSGTVASVSVTVNGGPAKALAKTNWGTWAASVSAPKGSTVVFTAKDPSGATATSKPIAWLVSTGTTPAPAPSLTATFTPKSLTNHWWVETGVSASAPLAKVEVKLNNGAWTALPKTGWGTYAKSLSVPAGTQIVFRATSTTGATATSGVFVEK
ncbi:MAG TPA: hypothetical protein VHI93_07625, partial [Candidatus Thermoplasmatota archaeon]|nr:hypothetical protein [Candidatus Thermoplasmatota archaeon]